jgi:hypothetical protein
MSFYAAVARCDAQRARERLEEAGLFVKKKVDRGCQMDEDLFMALLVLSVSLAFAVMTKECLN